MSTKKIIGIVLIVFVILGLLRESGFVSLHYANIILDNRMHIELHSETNVEKDGKLLPSSDEKKIDSQMPLISVLSWNAGFESSPRSTVLASIHGRLQKALADRTKLKIKVKNSGLSGLYWLPLYKSGSAGYEFYVEAVGENSRVYRGHGKGEIKFTTAGIMSVNEVKETLSEQIAADLSSTLKREAK